MSTSNMQTKILRRARTADEYRLYRAALEWDLQDPIVIETQDDLKSKYRWDGQIEPYHHQVTNLITFCRRLPVTLLADDVGLGKTISAGLVISELISRSRLSKVLIVCPKLLCQQWREELHSKFKLESEIAIGNRLSRADPKGTGAVITTYQSARMYLESIPQDRFQMLVLDEAHKLRNLYGVENPPQVAKCFRKALEERRFRFVLMLTATPIQNRLWDLYSLIDLLTVARGHKNPFGSEGAFARKFIADKREEARRLKPETTDEFRSIVYGYMSRVRRGDARLYFPTRVVHMRKVDPTAAELQLIETIAGPIQKLNRLVQISILQALTSSPEALMAQLINMARKGTVPHQLALNVRDIVKGMPSSAKLQGLGTLIETLKRENSQGWRLVVFTCRIETQTTIQLFLESHGFKVGIINGTSGSRNQQTIEGFRKNPPDHHIIVSTEAGAEGVNLQVANVLVNYDLPWNPMIVEQRIGRVQRLASQHANVVIFNITLRGTFEEYIVGRLMQKLQMASHAIGDIEALLGAAGADGDDDGGSFEEKIRQLVLAALAGADFEAATRQAEQSIVDAKGELEREEKNINDLLGGMDGAGYVGPKAPKLPEVERSMQSEEFALAALESLGIHVTPQEQGRYLIVEDGRRTLIRFNNDANDETGITLYAPGTASFARLVDRTIASGVHALDDLDQNTAKDAQEIVSRWVVAFGGIPKVLELQSVRRCFEGTAVAKVRATVAHDSYERLVDVPCSANEHYADADASAVGPLPSVLDSPSVVGLSIEQVANAAVLDPAIAEFSRFYLERRAQEVRAAGEDERKRKKLEDEFTPRLEAQLVAIDGKVHRQLTVKAKYALGSEFEYTSVLKVTPHAGRVFDEPEMRVCANTGRTVPTTCLTRCQISGQEVLHHLLVSSEVSQRVALPEYAVHCALSGKRALRDEVEQSAVSGQFVLTSLLKTSAVSGNRAEADHFGRCEFTQSEVLNSELSTSEVSGKRYRCDEQIKSAASGKTGHRQEFITCCETGQVVASSESEMSEVSGKRVRIGVLEQCAITQKHALPSELERCAASGKRVIKSLLVPSSVSGVLLLEKIAVRSTSGKFCLPREARKCSWSDRRCHPHDLRVCELTGLPIHVEFATSSGNPTLSPWLIFSMGSGEQQTNAKSGLMSRRRLRKRLAVVDAAWSRRLFRLTGSISPYAPKSARCLDFGLARLVSSIHSVTDPSLSRGLGQRNSKGWSLIRV